ncbi:hypothetical protein Tco_0326571 [Tanacetum coccineum]
MDDLTSEGLSDDDFRRGCERPSDFKSGFYKDIDKLDSSYSWKIEKLDIKGSFKAKGRRTIVFVFDSHVILDEESPEALRIFTWTILG